MDNNRYNFSQKNVEAQKVSKQNKIFIGFILLCIVFTIGIIIYIIHNFRKNLNPK